MLYGNNIYSNLGNYAEIPADESYTYPLGYSRIMAESAHNDLALFSVLIQGDFEEVSAIREGYEGFSPNVILEAAGGIFGKIIEFFKTLVAKIKGIITSFFAKLDSVLMKDSKAFYEKYKKLVNNARWEGAKVKWSKPKNTGNASSCYDGDATLENAVHKLEEKARMMGIAYNEKMYTNLFTEKDESSFYDKLEDNAMEEYFLGQLQNAVKSPSWDSFDKDFHEALFDDEETLEGNDSDFSAMKSEVIQSLSSGDKFKRDYEKALNKFNKEVKKIVDGLEKTSNKILDLSTKTGDSDETYSTKYAIAGNNSKANGKDDSYNSNNDRYSMTGNTKWDGRSKKYTRSSDDEFEISVPGMKDKDRSDVSQSILRIANCQYKLSVTWQNAILKMNNCSLDAIKFHMKQCRSAYAAMVAHASKPANKIVNNESTILEFAQEASDYEFESEFEMA